MKVTGDLTDEECRALGSMAARAGLDAEIERLKAELALAIVERDYARQVSARDLELRRETSAQNLEWKRSHAELCNEVLHMRTVFVLAKAWRTAPHVGDANCRAGDCDSCPARDAEVLLGRAIDEAGLP